MKRLDARADRPLRKSLRSKKVASIVVEVTRADGTVLRFDGDEESQRRLDLFSRRAKAGGRPNLPWTLADNTTVDVTPEEMEEALDKALTLQGKMWFI